MTKEQKYEMLADILECDVEQLNEDLVLESIDNWGSMTKLSLIVLMEDEFGKTLSSSEITGFKTVGDILSCMC